MAPFQRLTAVAVPIDLSNVDTDRVIPARFLRRDRDVPEYSRFLFHDVRFDADGGERPEFVLNQAPYRGARIIVAAESPAMKYRQSSIFGSNAEANSFKNSANPADLEIAEISAVTGSGAPS